MENTPIPYPTIGYDNGGFPIMHHAHAFSLGAVHSKSTAMATSSNESTKENEAGFSRSMSFIQSSERNRLSLVHLPSATAPSSPGPNEDHESTHVRRKSSGVPRRIKSALKMTSMNIRPLPSTSKPTSSK